MNDHSMVTGIPQRQADAMLNACDYQIWQTVNAWLDLRNNDFLIVEGAEDFDVISSARADITQVKASPKAVSLQTESVQEAIGNFWTVQKSNPDIKIRLRYLTRGGICQEKKEPFGQGVKGLELWSRSHLSDTDIGLISEFLRNSQRLPDDLKTWLANGAPKEIHSNLIVRIDWLTHSDSVDYVERSVQNKLIEIGKVRGNPPVSLIEKIAKRLHSVVWETLRKPVRRLDLFELGQAWDKETRVSISAQDHEHLIRKLATPASPLDGLRHLQPGSPPMPGFVVSRDFILTELRDVIESTGLLNIYGSTRTGKTTLAKLVVKGDASWFWWTAGGRSPVEIAKSLSELAQGIHQKHESIFVVIDDLLLDTSALAQYEHPLGDLIFAVRTHRGRLLITSHKPISPRLQRAFNLSSEQICPVPPLQHEEIIWLAEKMGCYDEAIRNAWATFIMGWTHGHPQLISAHLTSLQQRRWPTPSTEELQIERRKIDDEKSEARESLSLLSEQAKSLLYRLMIFPVTFRKDHAIEFATSTPSITLPGDHFDHLVGPWIEPLHDGYFKISALLSSSAEQIYPRVEITGFKSKAIKVLSSTSPATSLEAASAFQLAWEIKDEGALTGIILSLTRSDELIIKDFRWRSLWFIWEKVEEGDVLYPVNPTLSLLLRREQFMISLGISPESASLVAESWFRELVNLPENNDEHLAIYAIHVLPHEEVKLSPSRIIALFQNVAIFMENPIFNGGFLEHIKSFKGIVNGLSHDVIGDLAFFTSRHFSDSIFLGEFLRGISNLQPDLRERILDGFAGPASIRLIFDRVWFSESEKDQPNWDRCLEVFEEACQLAQAWGREQVLLAAMRGISIIHDEYLHNSEAARAALDRISAGIDSYEVHDRYASIYFSEKRYSLAENEWGTALSKWPPAIESFSLSAAIATQQMAIAAAMQGEWGRAAAYFMHIPGRLPKPGDAGTIAGAFADAGFAQWKDGNKSTAVTLLIDAWEVAGKLPSGKGNLDAFTVRKSVGHIISWVHETVTGLITGVCEPRPGMASSWDRSDRFLELPETETMAPWLMLIRIEKALDLGDRAYQLSASESSTASPAVSAVILGERLSNNLRKGDVENLPMQRIAWMKAASAARESNEEAKMQFPEFEIETLSRNDPYMGPLLFVAGILASVGADGRDWRRTLSAWRSSLPQELGKHGWYDWFDETERVLSASMSDAIKYTQGQGGDLATSMLGAINILQSQDASPEAVVLAHARLLCQEQFKFWLKDVALPLCSMIETQWGRIVETPALLQNPRSTVPEIKAICEEIDKGLAKVAKILLVSRFAVSVRLPSEIIAKAQELAGGNH